MPSNETSQNILAAKKAVAGFGKRVSCDDTIARINRAIEIPAVLESRVDGRTFVITEWHPHVKNTKEGDFVRITAEMFIEFRSEE